MQRIFIGILLCTLLFPAQSNVFARSTELQTPSFSETDDEKNPLKIVSASDDVVILDFVAPDFHATKTSAPQGVLDSFAIAGFDTTRVVGYPELPVSSSLIAVPPDAEVFLRVLESGAAPVRGSFDFLRVPAPATPDFSALPDATATALDLQQNIAALNSVVTTTVPTSGIFPAGAVEMGEIAWLRDQRVVPIRFFPLQANLATGELTFSRRLRVAVEFRYPNGKNFTAASTEAESVYFEPLLQKSIANYESARQWRTSSAKILALPTAPQTGEFKIVVSKDGLYRVTYADLVGAGLPTTINPKVFALRNQDTPIPIFVSGEMDGRFDSSDFIEFYGEAVDSNDTRSNVYWLSVNGPPGPRMDTRRVVPGNAPVPTSFRTTKHFEESNFRWTQHFVENRTWWWLNESLYENATATQVTVTVPLFAPAVAPQTQPVGVRVAMAANTDYPQNPDHHVRAYFNNSNTLIAEKIWNARQPIVLDGNISPGNFFDGNNALSLRAVFDLGTTFAYDVYFVDWVELTYDRFYRADNDALYFQANAANTWRFQVDGFTAPARLLDVTDAKNPVRLTDTSFANGKLVFQDASLLSTRYYAVAETSILRPEQVERYVSPPINLRDTTQRADYLIITHSDFLQAVTPLAQWRTGRGMQVKVIDVAWLYDQFNGGVLDPQAIRNFLSYAYHNWATPAPSFVLLVGDTTFNPLGFNPARYGPTARVFVPTFNLMVDPYAGEVSVDNHFVTVSGDDLLPDMYIGRFPAQTAAQAETMVNKTIEYERTTPPGDWKQRLLFVTDNYLSSTGSPDPAGNFEAIAERVIHESVPSWYNIRRVYYDPSPNAPPDSWRYDTVNETRAAIAAAMNEGAVFTNYIGHAYIDYWGERLWKTGDSSLLTNAKMPTIALSMDCLDGYFDYPNTQGLAETLIRQPGGTVAHFAPTGLGVATGHDILHKGFYEGVFKNGVQFFGAATLAGKLELFSMNAFPDLIQTFTMFGDPALQFSLPQSPLSLDVKLAASPAQPVGLGSWVTFDVSYANTSSVLADNVELRFVLPESFVNATVLSTTGPNLVLASNKKFVWQIPSFPAGARGKVSVRAQVSSLISSTQAPINLTAELNGRWTEQNVSDNKATLTVDVLMPDAFEPDDALETARPLAAIGSRVRHTLHADNDTDWTSFDAIAGQSYWIQTAQLTGSGDTRLAILNSDGVIVANNADFLPGSRWSGAVWKAPASGRYFIRVAAQGAPGAFAYDLVVLWQKQRFFPVVKH